MEAPRLRTPRCVVRPLQRDDVAELARYRNDPIIAQYQSWTSYSHAEAIELVDDLATQPFGEVGSWYQLGIARLADDRLLGDIGLHFVDEHQIELGFTLAREHHGQGFAREAVGTVVDWIFATLERHRCFAITDALNAGAARLLESLGFRREAHHIDNILFKGQWGSEYVYARLRREASAA